MNSCILFAFIFAIIFTLIASAEPLIPMTSDEVCITPTMTINFPTTHLDDLVVIVKEALSLYTIATTEYITEHIQTIRIWIAALLVAAIVTIHLTVEYKHQKQEYERKLAAYREQLELRKLFVIKKQPEPEPEIEMLPTSIDLSLLEAKPTKIYHYVPPTPRKKDNFTFHFDPEDEPEDYEGDHQAKRVKHEHIEEFWDDEKEQEKKYGDLKPEFIKYLRQLAEFQKRIDLAKRQAQLTLPPTVKPKKPRKSCGF